MNKNKRNLYNFLFFLTMFFLLTFNINSKIFGYDATNFNPEYGVTTANVNLRKVANLETSSILFTLPQNTNLKIVGTLDDFYIVQPLCLHL